MFSSRLTIGCDEFGHRLRLIRLGSASRRDQILHVGVSDGLGVKAHHLADAPRSALQRRLAIQADGVGQPVVLVDARGAVTARLRATNVRVRRVEGPTCALAEDVPFKKDRRTSIGQKPASQRLNVEHGPELGCANPQIV